MTPAQLHEEKIRILRERLELRIEEGDPILKALKGKGLGLIEAFMVWLELDNKACEIYWEAIHSGIHPAASLAIYEQKKQEIAEILKREVS